MNKKGRFKNNFIYISSYIGNKVTTWPVFISFVKEIGGRNRGSKLE
jgi:hypothetical protein